MKKKDKKKKGNVAELVEDTSAVTAKKKLKKCVNCGVRAASKAGICSACGLSKKELADVPAEASNINDGETAVTAESTITVFVHLELAVPVTAVVDDLLGAQAIALASAASHIQIHPGVKVVHCAINADSSESGQ